MADDRFRSSSWTDGDRQRFEAKLARARKTSRAQYLRIQAWHLAQSDDANARDAAGALYRRVLDDYRDDELQAAMAASDLGRWHRRRGEVVEAIEAMRAAVSQEDALGSLDWGADIDLAEMLLETGGDPAEVERLLARAGARRIAFKATRWRWFVASARLARNAGDHERAREHAASALGELADEEPDFARHPDLGRIEADPDVVREMTSMAAG